VRDVDNAKKNPRRKIFEILDGQGPTMARTSGYAKFPISPAQPSRQQYPKNYMHSTKTRVCCEAALVVWSKNANMLKQTVLVNSWVFWLYPSPECHQHRPFSKWKSPGKNIEITALMLLNDS
jgi:hypothetical protein